MPCFDPIPAYYAESARPDGSKKKSIYFNAVDVNMAVPCGRCIGCRIEKKKEWTVRCMHEASLYEENCFINLTYDDKYLPEDNSLHHEDFQAFMKRLRRKYDEKKIRFFMSGEYGPNGTQRPHYHAILFNHDFEDKKPWKKNEHGDQLYTSEILEERWSLGFCSLGAVTHRSASYVAGYVEKKLTGDLAKKTYGQRNPEYGRQSNRPGIGKDWLIKYADDVYPDDFVLLNGRKMRPPKYYDGLVSKEEPELMESIKEARKENNADEAWTGERSTYRLKIREICAKAKFSLGKKDEL